MVTLLDTVEDKDAKEICGIYNDRPETLLEILHSVQKKQGFLSDQALRTIADALNISRAEIHGVVSFYHDFKREAQAKVTIKICRAEACQAVGANQLIADAETAFGTKLDQPSKTTKLEATYCLGNCALGPAAMVGEKLYGRVSVERLESIIEMNEGSDQ